MNRKIVLVFSLLLIAAMVVSACAAPVAPAAPGLAKRLLPRHPPKLLRAPLRLASRTALSAASGARR